MSFSLDFLKKETYDSLKTGINIKAVLRSGSLQERYFAKIDTGAEVCLFQREIAESLEIDVESGYWEKFETLAGGLYAYQHEIELETLGLQFLSTIYFAESYAVRRNLLGRRGWLQLVALGLNDQDCELYLAPRFGDKDFR